MNRREFLVRVAGLAATPIVLQIVACGDDGSPAQVDKVSFPGSAALPDNHTHTGTITCTQLNGGVTITITSSVNSGHSHPVTISDSQLATVKGGGTVMIITNDQSHTHTWTITKPTGVC